MLTPIGRGDYPGSDGKKGGNRRALLSGGSHIPDAGNVRVFLGEAWVLTVGVPTFIGGSSWEEGDEALHTEDRWVRLGVKGGAGGAGGVGGGGGVPKLHYASMHQTTFKASWSKWC